MHLAVVILAHNAVNYVQKALRSLRRQEGVDYEIILVDSGSGPISRCVLFLLGLGHRVGTYLRSSRNLYFSAGMNLGARVAGRQTTHLLLLNSDIEFLDPAALKAICRTHVRGATGLRVIENNPVTIADGFCFLVDRDLFESLGGLDEQFPWTKAITKLEANLLRAGYSVQAIAEYGRVLTHFGGKSGTAWKAVHKPVDPSEARSWFEGVPPVTVVSEVRPD